MKKVAECPGKLVSALSKQDVGTLTRKEAGKMARAIGKDRAQKRRIAAALKSLWYVFSNTVDRTYMFVSTLNDT